MSDEHLTSQTASFDDDATCVIGNQVSASSELLPISGPVGVAWRQVGRYQITERIGRGGMASVFRAHDPTIDRVIAIKFLHAAFCEEEEYRARFLSEARAAGMLSHSNIVTVHDVGEIEGRPYLAMELIEGESLNEVMARTGAMQLREALRIVRQLAKALDYAHSKGIVHRDIKPSNIMCVRGSGAVKVTDFGIAHVTSNSDVQQTRVGDVLGTPQYMSPEQTKGAKVDGRSDLFSVGIVLYQMIGGHPPFQGDSIVALAMKIANEEPVPIEKLRADLPQSVRRIVERCLVKQSERRFQTGGELAEAIDRALREMEEDGREATRPRVVSLRVKWSLMMATIVFAVMALTGVVIYYQQKAALMDQVADYGSALSRFIATQNAQVALAEEWVAVEVAVQEMMKTGDFASVVVADRSGVVRASSDASLVGKPYKARSGESLGGVVDRVNITRYEDGSDKVLGFESPMTFQGKPVGFVALGIAEKPLARVAQLSLTLMGILVIVTVLAVAGAMYFVANWFARPIRLLGGSLTEIAQGRFEHRIRQERKDEFGVLFESFNEMAHMLQQRFMQDSVNQAASYRAPEASNRAAVPGGANAGDA